MDIVSYLPHLQAALNAITVASLVAGYRYVRRGNRSAHRRCMLFAAAVSVLFLGCYLYYHSRVGNIPFAGEGAVRPFYFLILASHVILAAINIPLVVVTLVYAGNGRFVAHRRLARRVLVVWIYVSVTGLLVYLFAFHLYVHSPMLLTRY